MSRLLMPAKVRIARRYDFTVLVTMAEHCLASKPRLRAGDLEAGGQALDVPLERSGMGLVEVVDVEDERPLGRGEPAEVGEVGIAAELDGQARAIGGAEVVGHDRGGAPVERERGRSHAPVADRDELGRPASRACCSRMAMGSGRVCGRGPLAVGGAGQQRPRSPAAAHPHVDAGPAARRGRGQTGRGCGRGGRVGRGWVGVVSCSDGIAPVDATMPLNLGRRTPAVITL